MGTYFNSTPPNLQSNGINSNNEQRSNTNNDITNSFAAIDKISQKEAINYTQPSSTSQPVENLSLQPLAQGKYVLCYFCQEECSCLNKQN